MEKGADSVDWPDRRPADSSEFIRAVQLPLFRLLKIAKLGDAQALEALKQMGIFIAQELMALTESLEGFELPEQNASRCETEDELIENDADLATFVASLSYYNADELAAEENKLATREKEPNDLPLGAILSTTASSRVPYMFTSAESEGRSPRVVAESIVGKLVNIRLRKDALTIARTMAREAFFWPLEIDALPDYRAVRVEGKISNLGLGEGIGFRLRSKTARSSLKGPKGVFILEVASKLEQQRKNPAPHRPSCGSINPMPLTLESSGGYSTKSALQRSLWALPTSPESCPNVSSVLTCSSPGGILISRTVGSGANSGTESLTNNRRGPTCMTQ